MGKLILKASSPVTKRSQVPDLREHERAQATLEWAFRQNDTRVIASAVRDVALAKWGIKGILRMGEVKFRDVKALGEASKPVNMELVERVLEICGFNIESLQKAAQRTSRDQLSK